jgi:hypothetical protein
LPVFDHFQHFIEAKYVFGTHKVVAEHDQVHFSIHFLQSFYQRMGIAQMPLDGAKGMLTDGLPPFVILWVLFDIGII